MIVRKFELHRHNSPDRPFRIFAALLYRAFGDFVDQLLFACSVKEMFPNGQLGVYYRPDRPYKETLVRLAPQVDHAWPMPDGLAMDYFDTASNSPVRPPDAWFETISHYPDLILTPATCRFEKLSSLPRVARFRHPEPDLWEARLAKKVGPGWFVVIHYREPTYALRPSQPKRDFRIEDALPVYDAILGAGGQVVRIGHPGMTPLPRRAGLIDLAPDDLLLQVAAINRARFFMELSPSGPAQLALAFGCPLLRCNQTSIGFTFSDQAVAMPQRVITDAGRDVTLEILNQGRFNLDSLARLDGHTLVPNSPAQLLEGLALMLKHTSGTGWRAPEDRPPFDPPGTITLPLENRLDIRLMV